MHKPLKIENLSLSFPSKTCFESFSTEIHYGSRIAIIGRNGSGKSSLLKLLHGVEKSTSREMTIPSDVIIGYVPQVITDYADLSGGERFNRALTQALSVQPNFLLLDEPTNHLDDRHRRHLLRWLKHFKGTLLIVSHDLMLLRESVDTFWHIDQAHIKIFKGHFDDYQENIRHERARLESSLLSLKNEKKILHQSLMSEQHRAAKSKSKGAKSIKQRKWPTIVSHSKASRSQETSGRKKALLLAKKQAVLTALDNLYIPEVMTPQFHLRSKKNHHRFLSIHQGTIGYTKDSWLLKNIHLSIAQSERIALIGDNGSGKSTLFKAILGKTDVLTSGDWMLPKVADIGYLDQHYQTLDSCQTVLTSMSHFMPDSSHIDIRHHLSDFLFRSQEEVNQSVSKLSGGEKVRLSLAHIAAQTPELLLLDEITNNLDLETRQHTIEVLKAYPGSLIVISHDKDFLHEINIEAYYQIDDDEIFLKCLSKK